MAFDAARGELVLFGGDVQSGPTNETWVWDGVSWTQRFPLDSPSKRSGHAMAYDAARGEVVLFGNNGTEKDTWVWDGTNWTEKHPVTAPGIQINVAMAYDAARGQVVMLGQFNSPYRTWVWDGTNWTGKLPANEPPVNGATTMAYDSAHGEVVLFGNTVYNDTWVWDGTNWTRKNPVNRPPARTSSAMAYDSVNGQVVLYGGYQQYSQYQTVFDTWVWDGANWTQRTPATIPPRRSGHALAYDTVRGRVVLFGGDSWDDQTWTWDGTNWSQSTTPSVRPTPRYSHSMAYDTDHEQVVLFGGRLQYGQDYPNDTWVWGGASWKMKTPLNSPSGRFQSALAYDANRKQAVLFGGFTSSAQNDTWVWDGLNWTLKSPIRSPPPRSGHAMAYDAERGQVVLFGGVVHNTSLGDTWVWDGTNWTQKNPASNPPARYYHAMAYDSTRRQVVLFGGGSYMNDTWIWDGSNWTELHPNSIPTGRWGHAMAYEGSRNRVVLFGGVSEGGSYSLPLTWTWDGTDWTAQNTPQGSPSGRLLHAMAYDGDHEAVVLFGGSANAIPRDDTWISTGLGSVCTYGLSSTGARVPSTASTGSADVIPTGSDCAWTVSTSGAVWLGISSGSSGTTTGQIGYSVAPNLTTSVRTAAFFVGGKVFTVTQDAAPGCSYQLSSPGVSKPFAEFSGSFTLTTSLPDCPWNATASSTGGWLQLAWGQSGTGTASVGYSMSANFTSAERTGTITVAGQVFTVKQAGVPPVTLSLSRSALAFATTTNVSPFTPPQEVFVGMIGGSNTWTAASDATWLRVTPASGQGNGKLSISVALSALTPTGTLTGKITIHASGATNGPLVINCTLTIKSAATGPFGSFDTPANNSTGVSGSIAVTGWALDDIAVNKVTIWRDPIGPEPVHPNGYVYIGDAMFVPGTRPDVEARYPSNPRAYRAGWGYLLLTNTLPGAGNGTFKLHAIAVDEEGNPFELGSKTITVDNLHATKPFGAIDSPAPGQSISGAFLNQGWALTPPPAAIATNGATIWVNVDGVDIGHPSYGFSRSDISSIFPGYANSNTSAGSYYLITSLYSNTMHAISWNVYDNQGRGDGIGSRYFYIQNAGAAASAVPEPVAGQALDAEQSFQLRSARLRRPAAPAASYPAFRRGYDRDAALTPIRQAGEGLLEPLEVDELDKLEIHLAAGQPWTAALRVGDESRDLPIGSTFDAEGGIFYWQLGPGFLGEFTLEFRAEDGTVVTVTVRVGHAFQVVE